MHEDRTAGAFFTTQYQTTAMDWEDLFERASEYDVTETEVRNTLDRLRGEDDDAA